MRGQKMNDAQKQTVNRLLAKGWRGEESDMFALAVPMYYDRPYVGLPRPHVIHVRRDGSVHRGYPRSKNYWTEKAAGADADAELPRCIHGAPRNVFCGKCES